jgi:hypothetical protein
LSWVHELSRYAGESAAPRLGLIDDGRALRRLS